MKTTKYLLILAAVAITFGTVACSSGDVAQDNNKQEKTEPDIKGMTAFVTGDVPVTRTSIGHTPGGDATAFWQPGDKIWINNAGMFQQSSSSNITAKKNSARFYFTGTLTAGTYPVYYTGSNGTTGNQVTIAATQTQSQANNTDHFGTSGDCGVATATNDRTNHYNFQLDHKAAYLCLLPRTENPLISGFVVQSITVTADNDIAGDFALSTSGLAATPTTNGSKTITLTVNDFPLKNVTSPTDNAAYIVMAPQTTALNITYKLHNAMTGVTGTVTKNIPTQTYDPNTVYDITSNLVNKDYTEEVKPYMWDAKKWYFDGKTAPYTAADGPQSKVAAPDRWYNDAFTANKITHAQNSCKDCPTDIQMLWYIAGEPFWDTEELWTAEGKVYQGVIRFKKWSALVADHGASLTTPPTAIPGGSVTNNSYGGEVSYGGNNFSVGNGLPAPAEFVKYFTLPGLTGPYSNFPSISSDYIDGYWSSCAPGTNQYPPALDATYMMGLGNGGALWVSAGITYIARKRSSARRAVKFE